MKKLKTLSLLGIAALMVTGCGGRGLSSLPSVDPSSDVGSSLNSNDAPGSESEAPSSNPAPSSSTPAPSSSTPAPSSSTPAPSSSTPAPSSSEPAPSSSEAPAPTWTAAEKAVIKEHFYDANIPYVGVDGCRELAWYAQSDCALKYGGTSSKDALDSIAATFEAAGWDDNGPVALGTAYTNYYGYYYNFEKGFNTADGVRYVSVLFGGLNSSSGAINKDGSGMFYCQIEDPYYYTWPADLVADAVETWEKTDTVPAFNDFTFIQALTDDVEDGELTLYCYTSNANAQSVYAGTLALNGYVANGEDEDGYALYNSPNGELQVAISYDSKYKDLDIIITPLSDAGDDNAVWPAEQIAAIVNTEWGYTEVVPAFNDATEYECCDYYAAWGNYFPVYCSTEDSTSKGAYEAVLEAAGYVLVKSDAGYDYYSLEGSNLHIAVDYNAYYQTLDILFYNGITGGSGEEEPTDYSGDYDAWPTDVVSAIVSDNWWFDEDVPAYEGADSYYVQASADDIEYGEVCICCGTDDPTSKDTYAALLIDAGYEFIETRELWGDEVDFYAASDSGFEIGLIYSDMFEELDIYLCNNAEHSGDEEYYFEWPTPIVNGLIYSTWGVEAEIPAYTGGTIYVIGADDIADYGYFTVACATTEEDPVTTYGAALTAAGYEMGEVEGMTCYLSADGNLMIVPYVTEIGFEDAEDEEESDAKLFMVYIQYLGELE